MFHKFALIISTAAGIISTRNTNEDALGLQVSKQFKIHPKAIYIAGGVLLIFAIIPGLPALPFTIVGLFLGYVAHRIEIDNERVRKAEQEKLSDEKVATAENLEDLLSLELVELEVGYGLVNLVDADQNGDLLERITHIRKQFALDWGLSFLQLE